MATFKVFHAKSIIDSNGFVTGIKGRFGFEASSFPDDFQHVADVEAPTMGAVFQLTNSIDHPWTENDEVHLTGRLNLRGGLRSTSVGDVIQDGNQFYAVGPVGFVLLAALDENFQAPVPRLY